MIVRVDGKAVRLEPATQKFIEELSDKTGTPANEIVSAIVNGHMGRWS